MAGLPQTINEWEWVKVATGVTNGIITRLDSAVYYYQTWFPTGDPAPTPPVQGTTNLNDEVKIFEQSNEEPIGSTFLIDVYIMCANSDDDDADSGKIRVDL